MSMNRLATIKISRYFRVEARNNCQAITRSNAMFRMMMPYSSTGRCRILKKINMQEVAEEAIIQVMITIFTLNSLKKSVSTGNPAWRYWWPYLRVSSQKWGICQIKRKNARKIIFGSFSCPPAAVHPIRIGIAPVRAPGTTAKAVLRFSQV